MGHQLLRDPPTTKEWHEVVRRIDANDKPEAVADAAVKAVQATLMRSCKDIGVIEVIYLLCNVPYAARQPAFAEALAVYGVEVATDPNLIELLAGITEAVDARLFNSPERTDMNEMAQATLVETFAKLGHEQIHRSLYPTHSECVRQALLAYDTRGEFGTLSKHFFARFVYKCMDYFLSRTVGERVGDGKRFANLRVLRAYMKDLEQHCFKAAEVLVIFSDGWLKKEHRAEVCVTREAAGHFLFGAMNKLVETLMHTEARYA